MRCCKLALNNGLSGQLDGPSSYLMKSPMHQRPDDEARELTEEFIAKYARRGAGAGRTPASVAGQGVTTGPRSGPPNKLPRRGSERLAIAQVTPFAWEVADEVNDYVARVSRRARAAAVTGC